jgi:hypothetical protein
MTSCTVCGSYKASVALRGTMQVDGGTPVSLSAQCCGPFCVAAYVAAAASPSTTTTWGDQLAVWGENLYQAVKAVTKKRGAVEGPA